MNNLLKNLLDAIDFNIEHQKDLYNDFNSEKDKRIINSNLDILFMLRACVSDTQTKIYHENMNVWDCG